MRVRSLFYAAGSGFEITTSDNAISLIDNYNGGSNSFERVAIGKPAVKQITVILHGGGAIADILFEKSICESVDIVDFITYPVGAVVTNLSTAVVSAMKNTTSGLVAGEAMIFDSSKPNKIDKDLGTPNRSFGGPGVGKGGKKGQLFENFMAKGNILIISEDGGEIDPEDNGLGGTLTFKFLSPTYVDSIGILDNVQGVDFKISTSDGGWTKVSDGNGGSNSFELVKLGKPGVTEIVVTLKGSGGVTELNSCSALP